MFLGGCLLPRECESSIGMQFGGLCKLYKPSWTSRFNPCNTSFFYLTLFFVRTEDAKWEYSGISSILQAWTIKILQ